MTSALSKLQRNYDYNILHNDSKGTPLPNKNPSHTRFYFQNPNGISAADDFQAWREHLQTSIELSADCYTLSETNINSNHVQTISKLSQQTRKLTNLPSRLFLNNSTIPFETSYQPGGTLQLLQGSITGRISQLTKDPLGRWQTLRCIGKNNRVVNLITAYQVCTNPTNKTGTTAYHQQSSLLRQQNHPDTNPRKHFRKDFIKMIQELYNKNELFIICGDWNQPLTHNSVSTQLCRRFQLCDPYGTNYPDDKEFATYIRGTQRIDYILISSALLQSVINVGYEPFHFRNTGDHRSMYIDFDTQLLFGNQSQQLLAPAFRDLSAKDPIAATTYIPAKYEFLRSHNFVKQLETLLQDPEPNPEQFEKLDTYLVDSARVAGKKCKQYRRPWYTQDIAQLLTLKYLLRRLIQGFKNNHDQTDAIIQTLRA